MKTSEVVKAAKSWLKLSNYDALQEITVYDLKREVIARLELAEYHFAIEIDEGDRM